MQAYVNELLEQAKMLSKSQEQVKDFANKIERDILALSHAIYERKEEGYAEDHRNAVDAKAYISRITTRMGK